jgi:hypothetical protein
VSPDPFDADLSSLRNHVDNVGPWLAIWEHRAEPDAHARRCANDTMDAIDGALAALHRIRAELVTQIRQADDEAAARVDALLGQARDGPPSPFPNPEDRHGRNPTASPKAPQASATASLGGEGGSGRAPHQEPP